MRNPFSIGSKVYLRPLDLDDIAALTAWLNDAEVTRNLGEKSAWDKGYGTEATRLMVRYAFDTLNLNRVWLHVYEDNEHALHVYPKVGFRIEGRLRQSFFRDGRYWDTLVMAVLREEWKTPDRPLAS
jgi:diamine N-acetyltransferase